MPDWKWKCDRKQDIREENINMGDNRSWELPDPFLREDGSRVVAAEEWKEQREYFKRILEEQYYGKMPPRPDHVRGERGESKFLWEESAIYERVRLYTGPEEKVAFHVHVYRPQGDEKRMCIVIPGGDGLDPEILQKAVWQGAAVLSYEIDEAAPDDTERWNQGSCALAYPEYSWRSLAMWAWLASRVIDWLEAQSFADLNKVVVTGHSRMGKMALCCGIYDERAAITAPAGSGCGGMGSLRLTGSRLGENSGNAERIGVMLRKDRFYYWLLDGMAEYGTADGLTGYRENELSFDADILGACIAPRGLFLAEGLDDQWSNVFGTQISWLAAAEVYRWMGASDKCAIHYRVGGHEYNLEDWTAMLDFCRNVLEGTKKQTNYKIMKEGEVKCGYSWEIPCVKTR